MRTDKRQRAALVSLSVGILVLSFKLFAYFLTSSVALLSDALESLINVFSALILFLILTYAKRPPDKKHPYGHEKAEYFSSGMEGSLLFGAGITVLFVSVKRLLLPVPLKNLDIGIIIAAVASAINFGAGHHIYRIAKRQDSIALEADAKHLFADVLTSLAIIIGAFVVLFTRIQFLDSLIGIVVGLHILRMGFSLSFASLKGLIDERLPEPEEQEIRKILNKFDKQFVSYHAFRTRKSASRKFLDLHLVVHRKETLNYVHKLCDEVEKDVEKHFPNIDIIIHPEPCDYECSICSVNEEG